MNNNCLDWSIFLAILSSYTYGQYFLAKRLVREEKVTTKDVASQLKHLPFAYVTGVIGFYLLAVYVFGDKYKTIDLIIAVALTVIAATASIWIVLRIPKK